MMIGWINACALGKGTLLWVTLPTLATLCYETQNLISRGKNATESRQRGESLADLLSAWGWTLARRYLSPVYSVISKYLLHTEYSVWSRVDNI